MLWIVPSQSLPGLPGAKRWERLVTAGRDQVRLDADRKKSADGGRRSFDE
jgi:hypothetical protein